MKGAFFLKQFELHTFGWYAARLSPHLSKDMFKPVPGRLWGGVAYLAVIIGGLLAIGFLNWVWLNVVISLILGFSFAAMGFLGHEILHGTVVRTPWLRNLFGAIAFMPLSIGPRLWRKWHNMNHHLHTQDEDNDPDSWPSMKYLAKSTFLRRVYKLPHWIRALTTFVGLTLTFTLHSTRMFFLYINDFKRQKRPLVWVQFFVPWIFWGGLLFWLGPLKLLFAFVIPLLIANFIVMCYISTNHRLNPQVPVNDPLANSLTVTVPKWVDVLHFNFSYHTEHHIFPGMNSKYYPKVKQLLKSKWPSRYHEMPMTQALITLWKTPRVYYKNRDLVDPRRGEVYGSLGNGLNPADVKGNKSENHDDLV